MVRLAALPSTPPPAAYGTIQVARTAIFPIALFMTARNKPLAKIVKKRGRGRPPKEDAASETLSVALSKGLIAELDIYCEREGKTRSTAIRQFVREGLKGKRNGR
jgi:Ribbon-helix-helix protein, copG family